MAIPDSITNSILEGSALLFVGAGVAQRCKNSLGDPLPDARSLRALLQKESGIQKDHTLDRVAGFYIRKFGPAKLYNLLKTTLTVESISRDIAEFYKLPWRRLYTTNYDDGIEFSRKSTRGHATYTLIDTPKNIPDGAVVHINGYIGSVTPEGIANQLRLTDYSYAASTLEAQSSWINFFRNDLRLSRIVVFLGYSLADLDISRVLLSEYSIKPKTHFFIAPDADEVEIASLEQYGTVNCGGADGLFRDVTQARRNFEPQAQPRVYYSIEDLSLRTTPRTDRVPPLSVIVHEQLVYGNLALPEVLADANVIGNIPLNIPRQEVERASDRLLRGEVRDLAIVGDIASGKTFAALGVARRLIASGTKVYWTNDGRKLPKDLDQIVKENERLCIIVDGYSKFIDPLRDYLKRRPSMHMLVATERSATHEIVWPRLRELLFSSLVPEVVLDTLLDDEVRAFEDLVNFSGLWPTDLAGRPPKQRQDFIRHSLDRSLYRLLLEVLKSQKVKAEIEALLSPLRENDDALRFFATAFIIGALGLNFWINDWQSFYGLRNVRDLLRQYADQIRHFVVVDTSSIRPRSGIASRYLLQNFIDDETILGCLVDIYHTAVMNRDSDSEFRDASYELMRYSGVEPLFSERNKLLMLVRYFNEIRAIGDTRDNPDYWLQLGIACTIASRFDDAETAFNNAYGRERAKHKPNLIKIDNYYARYQFERASWTDDSELALRLFREGNLLLLRQIFKDENRHYPFKAGRALPDISAKHFDRWTAGDQSSFVGGCRTLLKKAEEWEARNRTQIDVATLIREVRLILKRIDT